ncbi:nucleotide pyrophosphohydrolase [Vibrio vulnificus]|uniref:MazG nucleotide pyrophosphohydrolase domain-containing protein n=1 Tax=Vibrio vulnificus TaxID=672 RepID=UPI0009279E15|nr:MazG nucleotide pyrophosphohydrolase domain-containing protein [Vibrio vulnificus]EGQ8021534.1 nucleotide pyrophosphohydrolase [Vibrio vulnificus]EHT4939255.1 nucleotide pyrophosphohydrolase [Vibrio vulnificus]ELE1906625.1 nucleotide pyrophosphohydrolase [Vibrio vulnificus]MCA3961487.1 nucleotide pyrophosphohydrolase [Vibrio vulnificus]MCU8166203.1 nucleotide pyrophosphohydrolase [Vibrio vulnificus]
MKDFEQLLEVVLRKAKYDQSNSWYLGPHTYLNELKKEVDEVFDEIPRERTCYLEDELADVLWDYLNAIVALEKESEIRLDSILHRAYVKYSQRVAAIESGTDWADIKEAQKQALEQEYSQSSR